MKHFKAFTTIITKQNQLMDSNYYFPHKILRINFAHLKCLRSTLEMYEIPNAKLCYYELECMSMSNKRQFSIIIILSDA